MGGREGGEGQPMIMSSVELMLVNASDKLFWLTLCVEPAVFPVFAICHRSHQMPTAKHAMYIHCDSLSSPDT